MMWEEIVADSLELVFQNVLGGRRKNTYEVRLTAIVADI